MEVRDYSHFTDQDFERLIKNAEPCNLCGDKSDLAVGVITEGEGTGSLVIFCTLCQFEPFSLEEDEMIVNDYF